MLNVGFLIIYPTVSCKTLFHSGCTNKTVWVAGSRPSLRHGRGLTPVWPDKTKDMPKVCHFGCKQLQLSGMRSISIHLQVLFLTICISFASFSWRTSSSDTQTKKQTSYQSYNKMWISTQRIKILSSGRVFVDGVESQLPLFKCTWTHLGRLSTHTVTLRQCRTNTTKYNRFPQTIDFPNNFAADIRAFKPSSFYILVVTSVGLKAMVQLSPVMQVFVTIENSLKGQSTGKPSQNGALLHPWHPSSCESQNG